MTAQTAEVHTPTIPYITVAEYKQHPTSINTDTLVPKGGPAQQDAELARIIRQASAWCDREARQSLPAQPVTEQRAVQVDRQGRLLIHPSQWPLLELRAVAYGVDPSAMTDILDLSSVWIDASTAYVPLSGASASFVGSIPVGWFGAIQGTTLLCRYTFLAGWPCTSLTADAAQGSTVLQVRSCDGILPGMSLRVGTGNTEEDVTSVTASGTVMLASGLQSEQLAGQPVTALPLDLVEAAVLVTTAFIKRRGTDALAMGARSATAKMAGKTGPDDDLDLARDILVNYEVIR